MKELSVIFFSSFKFAMIFPVAVYTYKLSFYETLLYTNIGGWGGVFFFALVSRGFIKVWDYILINTWMGQKINMKGFSKNKKKKVFTKRNKRIVKIKSKYGLFGIVILNPILLSIPIGSFLVIRYYSSIRFKLIYLGLGVLGWSLIYTLVYFYLKELLFN